MTERVRGTKLDWAERWLCDGLRISSLPPVVQMVEIDMTRAVQSIDRSRAKGQRATFNHIIVRAAAMALVNHPELHQMLVGDKRYIPRTVTIGVSVATGFFLAPVLVIADPDRKTIFEIEREMQERRAGLRDEMEVLLSRLRRWGWLVPFSFCRQALLKLAGRHFASRQKMSGTIQVTSLPGSDTFVPLVFGGTAVLGVGRVADRVVAVNGHPAVRPTLNLACTSDHRVWDGRAGETFLGEIKKIIETGAHDEAPLTRAAALG